MSDTMHVYETVTGDAKPVWVEAPLHRAIATVIEAGGGGEVAFGLTETQGREAARILRQKLSGPRSAPGRDFSQFRTGPAAKPNPLVVAENRETLDGVIALLESGGGLKVVLRPAGTVSLKARDETRTLQEVVAEVDAREARRRRNDDAFRSEAKPDVKESPGAKPSAPKKTKSKR